MARRYLFFASHSYAYSILRPLQDEIRRRGDEAAWFLEPSCPDLLASDERRLHTFDEVRAYDPLAVFAPGNWIYDFFPGVKVAVFHGYPINKRAGKTDDHFTLRGWFDIYCTQGESSTPYFTELSRRHGYFKVYETGWCKADNLLSSSASPVCPGSRPTILYAATFSKKITSADHMYRVIERLAAEKPWNWVLTLHPKLTDPDLRARYTAIAARFPHVDFRPEGIEPEIMRTSDVLLCDSSSIIVEYELLDKPVVTFCNTHPGPHLIDVHSPDEVASAIERALTRPAELMEAVRRYAAFHERYRDGRNSARVLDAVDDFTDRYKGRIRPKPLNLWRRLKLRWRLRYFHWT